MIEPKDPPVVSVAIPVYNGERYLKATIESIQAQTLENWELVLVDDGSSDGSWELMHQAASSDCRIKVHKHESNSGHRAASNTAFRLCRGRYVARSDQDDLSLPTRLERQVNFMEEHPAVGLVAAGHYRLYPDGRRVAIRKTRESIFVRWGLLFDSAYCHSTFMFRKEFVSGESPYRYAPSAYDYEILSRLARETEIGAVSEPLVVYRIHENGLATTDKNSMSTAAVAISFQQLRCLFRPRRLDRKILCSLRGIAQGRLSSSDLEQLPLFFELLDHFQESTGASDREMKLIWRQTLRKLVASLPFSAQGILVGRDPVGVLESLITILHRASVRRIRRGVRLLVQGKPNAEC